MKTNKTVTFFSVLLLTLFFASCNTSFDIAKRQFNNGYYIHIASKKHIETDDQNIPVEKKEVPTIAVAAVRGGQNLDKESIQPILEVNEVPVFSASVDNNPLINAKKELKAAISSVAFVAPQKSVVEPGNSIFLHKKFHHRVFDMILQGPPSALLMILLCIFLPPIAVGIKTYWRGWKFWFALLLTILFYFPGMIYAFYVCFG